MTDFTNEVNVKMVYFAKAQKQMSKKKKDKDRGGSVLFFNDKASHV